MSLRDFTISNFIQKNAIAFKDRIAWKFEDHIVTHGEFSKNIGQLASGLIEIGIGKGDRIGILAKNSLHYVYLLGAAARIGAIVVPISWRLKPQEIEHVVSDSDPKILFYDAEFVPVPRAPGLEICCCLDRPSDSPLRFESLRSSSGSCNGQDVSKNDPYVIIYTAAVHGKPRGAVLTHENIVMANLQLMYFWQLTPDDTHLNLLPFYHIHGLAMCFSTMQAGGKNIILPKFDAPVTAKIIDVEKVTIFAEFAPMLSRIMDEADLASDDLSSLRIVSGLDTPETIRRLQERTSAIFWISYGQTETTGGTVSISSYPSRPGSAGIVSPLSSLAIIGPDGQTLEDGEIGEIVVRGPMVFAGYWKREKETEYTFRNGWHHTGDKGLVDADGYLWFKGPLAEKELIKTGGENVYPNEVEDAILAHPSIEEVVVFGVPDEQWGESIKAVCVSKRGTKISEKELINFVSDRIAGFKKPKYVTFVPSIPRDQKGVVDLNRVKNL